MDNKSEHNLFSLLAMLYFTLMIMAILLIYKMVMIGSALISIAIFIAPFWYVMSDVIAEVYGYNTAKRLIWYGLCCEFLFILIVASLVQLPSPTHWQEIAQAYQQTIGKLPRVFLGSILGVLASSFVNAYIVVRWKALLRGKLFWLRSIGATSIGELIFTAVTIIIDLFGLVPKLNLMQLITISYGIKLLVNILAVIPATALVNYLKRVEKIDVYEQHIEFNPFRLNR